MTHANVKLPLTNVYISDTSNQDQKALCHSFFRKFIHCITYLDDQKSRYDQDFCGGRGAGEHQKRRILAVGPIYDLLVMTVGVLLLEVLGDATTSKSVVSRH